MSAQSVGDIESSLTDNFERCRTTRDPSIPTGDTLAPPFRGALGHFPPYCPEAIVHTEDSLSMGILISANWTEMRHADPRMASH